MIQSERGFRFRLGSKGFMEMNMQYAYFIMPKQNLLVVMGEYIIINLFCFCSFVGL